MKIEIKKMLCIVARTVGRDFLFGSKYNSGHAWVCLIKQRLRGLLEGTQVEFEPTENSLDLDSEKRF